MALAPRPPFIPGAKFVALRDTPIAGIDVKRGDEITDEMESHLGQRRMRQLYGARWIGYKGTVEPTAAEPVAPLLAAPEGTHGTPEQPAAYEPPHDAEGDDIVPAAPPVEKREIVLGEPASVFHEGFGRWFKRDAAGNKLGDKMTKAQAEATNLPVTQAAEKTDG